jgi:hypothetical protein
MPIGRRVIFAWNQIEKYQKKTVQMAKEKMTEPTSAVITSHDGPGGAAAARNIGQPPYHQMVLAF